MSGGFSTFSWKATMRPPSPTSITPKSRASARGTGIAATVASAFTSWWKRTICRTSIL